MEEVALAEQLECGNELLGARAFGLLPNVNEWNPRNALRQPHCHMRVAPRMHRSSTEIAMTAI